MGVDYTHHGRRSGLAGEAPTNAKQADTPSPRIDFTHPRRRPPVDGAAPTHGPDAGPRTATGSATLSYAHPRRQRTRPAEPPAPAPRNPDEVLLGQPPAEHPDSDEHGSEAPMLPPGGESTLAFAERLMDKQRERNRSVARLAHQHRTRVFELFSRAEVSPHETFAEARQMHDLLSRHFQERYHTGVPSGSPGDHSGDVQSWLATATRLGEEMAGTRVPIFQQARLRQQYDFSGRLGPVLGSLAMAEQRTLSDCFDRSVRAGHAAVSRDLSNGLIPAVNEMQQAGLSIPPVVGPVTPAAVTMFPPVPGIGRLQVQAGYAYQDAFEIQLRRPGTYAGSASLVGERIELPQPVLVPLILDLDAEGGLVSDSTATVNDTILRLLALLPAGQVRAMVFDPAQLGDSVKFLYGLGDAAEAIIGDKVRSTDRELADMLVGLEEHITFVTQKYLQGQFDSLTEYNRAAGEVAEPYRLLVLYDFPAGFHRPGGGIDAEAMARLEKIVTAGPRTGVFTLAVAAQNAPLGPLSSLPRLFANWSIPAPVLGRMAFGDAQEPSAQTGQSDQPAPAQALNTLVMQHRGRGGVFTAGPVTTHWFWHPDTPSEEQAVSTLLAGIERGLTSAEDVRVTSEQVATLAEAKNRRAQDRGVAGSDVCAHPSRPDTWWKASSAEEIVATFGRVGASDVASLVLDSRIASGALIGGRPGSGKSVLIHALIDALTRAYAPDELALYLVDFKEGVEFQVYAAGALPHARVVAVESERDFGLSVLQSLDNEISRRGSLFRGRRGEELNLAGYRAQSREPLPRVVLLIDEFHVLFEREDKIAVHAAELLDRVVRQGRAFGVHAILASQTLAGTAGLGRHTLNQIPLRIALQSSDADSRLLLADDNPEARLLSRPGEGILNTKGGLKDANRRFQAAFTAPEERARRVQLLRRMADEHGYEGRPTVFQGSAPAQVEELDPQLLRSAAARSSLAFPVGLPTTLDGPVLATLRREPGGNLLVVLPEEDLQAGMVLLLTALTGSGVRVHHVNFGSLDAGPEAQLEVLHGEGTATQRSRVFPRVLEELAETIKNRLALSDHSARAEVLVLSSLHRARDLDPMSGAPESDLLEEVLRDGPDVGVHVIALFDKPISVERRLSRPALREFGIRLVGPLSKDDSFTLIDSDAATGLRPSEGILDDHDRGTATRLRRFALPTTDWISTALRQR